MSALRSIDELPGPKGVPFFGNARQISSMQFHLSLERWAQEFGPLCRVRFGPSKMLIVSDPVLIGSMLRDRPDVFRRTSRSARIASELLTTGVFSSEGEDWKRQRKLVMRGLTPEVIRSFFPTLNLLTRRLLERWQSAIAAGREVDVLRDLKAWTLDVTIWIAMGQDIDTLAHPDNPLQGDIEHIFNRMARRLTTGFPYWRYFKLPADRAADACSARIHTAVAGFVAETRKRIEANPGLRAKPTNLLEAFVTARDEPGSEFTDRHVIGNAITMVFAGEDTTSNTMAWLLDFLARDPGVAARMAAEADTVLGEGETLQEFAGLEKFTYTDACVDEAMRLKPVAPFLGLETNVETEVGDVRLEKHTPIMVITRLAGRSETDFPQADEFRPERWLKDKSAEKSSSVGGDPGRKLFPFGGGPRFCPGRYLAMAEIKMIMSMVAKNFTLEMDASAPPVKELFTFTMTPSSLPVKLRVRGEKP